MRRFSIILTALVVLFLVGAVPVSAAIVFDQGFEADTNGWFEYDSPITRVASGTNGITSASGNYHAIVGIVDQGYSGAFTRFDGYRDTWTGPWTAELDVYLDTSWASGSGFDYSVASNGSDDAHQRDFIFHVAKDTSSGKLLLGADNNSNFNTREDLDTLSNNLEITDSGWYTLQHVFYENGGLLAVDLNVLDSGGTSLFTETRTHGDDLIPSEVGGNRYGWLTFIDMTDGLAIDNTQLDVVPEPTTLLIWSLLGVLSIVFFARRR